MNPLLFFKALEALQALFSFIKSIADNNEELQKIVDAAHTEGRELDATDVRSSVQSMNDEVDKLAVLLSKKE